MYFVLYDRFLTSIGQTYIVESWSRIQRAVDFDELRITGEQIPYSADPFFVVVNDKQGKMMFSGLASTPQVDERLKKTTLSLKDYTTLLNSEIIIDWSQFVGATLAEYIDFVLTTWKTQISVGFDNIVWDVSELTGIFLDESIPLGEEKENVLAYTLVNDAMQYYNLHCVPELDVYEKTLSFGFKCSGVTSISVRLRDFGIDYIEKSFGEYNRATVYDSLYTRHQEWALTVDNRVVRLPSDAPLVYPAKNRNFIADEPNEDESAESKIYNAIYDAVMSLAGNRYQENLDLNAQQYRSILDMSSLDFSYKVAVYTDDGYYKDLPVGEIETDSKGKHIVRLGYRIQELTQEL